MRATCSCGARSGLTEGRTEAEKWERAHLREAQKIRLRLASQPSLKKWAMMCREQSQSPALTDEARALWAAEAQAMEDRLSQTDLTAMQMPLFEETP